MLWESPPIKCTKFRVKRFFIFVNDTSKLTAIKLWKLFCLIHIYHSSIGRPDWGLDSDIICFSLMSSHPTCYIPEIQTRLIECKFIYIVGLQLNAIVNHITCFHVDSIIVYTLERFNLRHRWWFFFFFFFLHVQSSSLINREVVAHNQLFTTFDWSVCTSFKSLIKRYPTNHNHKNAFNWTIWTWDNLLFSF